MKINRSLFNQIMAVKAAEAREAAAREALNKGLKHVKSMAEKSGRAQKTACDKWAAAGADQKAKAAIEAHKADRLRKVNEAREAVPALFSEANEARDDLEAKKAELKAQVLYLGLGNEVVSVEIDGKEVKLVSEIISSEAMKGHWCGKNFITSEEAIKGLLELGEAYKQLLTLHKNLKASNTPENSKKFKEAEAAYRLLRVRKNTEAVKLGDDGVNALWAELNTAKTNDDRLEVIRKAKTAAGKEGFAYRVVYSGKEGRDDFTCHYGLDKAILMGLVKTDDFRKYPELIERYTSIYYENHYYDDSVEAEAYTKPFFRKGNIGYGTPGTESFVSAKKEICTIMRERIDIILEKFREEQQAIADAVAAEKAEALATARAALKSGELSNSERIRLEEPEIWDVAYDADKSRDENYEEELDGIRKEFRNGSNPVSFLERLFRLVYLSKNICDANVPDENGITTPLAAVYGGEEIVKTYIRGLEDERLYAACLDDFISRKYPEGWKVWDPENLNLFLPEESVNNLLRIMREMEYDVETYLRVLVDPSLLETITDGPVTEEVIREYAESATENGFRFHLICAEADSLIKLWNRDREGCMFYNQITEIDGKVDLEFNFKFAGCISRYETEGYCPPSVGGAIANGMPLNRAQCRYTPLQQNDPTDEEKALAEDAVYILTGGNPEKFKTFYDLSNHTVDSLVAQGAL